MITELFHSNCLCLSPPTVNSWITGIVSLFYLRILKAPAKPGSHNSVNSHSWEEAVSHSLVDRRYSPVERLNGAGPEANHLISG